ncbi:hypothetical protein C2845_PM01G25060 [Panicum miliaceum]|uniref:Uncharacterized protein n=1 Tax=Panicum miliaceum TaxID=4540 RepID=A0A3L6TK38_PANMI|nr:hypothetical protein C2845_PM01G25060 [Panicum miliaceum]
MQWRTPSFAATSPAAFAASWCRARFAVPCATSINSGFLPVAPMAITSAIHWRCRLHRALFFTSGALEWHHHPQWRGCRSRRHGMEATGAMATRRRAPPFPKRNAGAERWPPGFAYDITVVPPLPPPQILPRSYADIASNRRYTLPSGSTLGAGFVSSEEEAFPRL